MKSENRTPNEDVFATIIKQRADRLGVSVDELMDQEKGKPRFLQSAEKEAAELGISVDDVLEGDLEGIETFSYPGPDCLQPDEVREYVQSGRLSDEAEAHWDHCQYCQVLLNAAEPRREWIDEFLQEVRYRFDRAPCLREREKAAVRASGSLAMV